MTPTPALAVLCVAYRTPERLDAMLRSVAEHLPGVPVLVHDNSGAHAHELDALVAAWPDVRWSRGGPNIGFAAGVNALAREVPGHDLLLLNPDAVLEGPLAATLAAVREPGVAAAAPLAGSPDGDERAWDVAHRERGLVRALVSTAGYAPRLRGTAASDLYAEQPRDDVDGYLTGACLAIAGAAWDAVGPFDEEYFLYGEESQWQRRARAAGFRLVLVDEPGVRHSAAGTVADDPLARRRSRALLRANTALELQADTGPRVGDTYLAGTSLLDRVQRSRRRERADDRTARRGTGRPSIVLTVNRLVYGGAERHHVVVAGELVRRGYDVTLVCLQRFGPLVAEVPHGVRLVRQPWWAPAIDLPPAPAVLVGGDTNTEAGFATLWRRGSLAQRRRWIVGAHVPPDPEGPTYSRPLAAAMARADAFVALSPRHRDQVAAHQRVASRFLLAPNGVEHLADLPADPTPRAPRADDAPLRLVMLSRIVEHKNPHLLVEALAGLADLSWTLDIFGDGPDRARLEALTPSWMADRVRWRGWSAGPGPALADADVLCLPSRAEAFPLTILEAMARQVPVVASASCAVPDMLDHGAAGVVVDDVGVDGWRTALATLLADPASLPALGRAGYDRMREHYTVDAMVDAYEAAVEEVLR